jgi:hypothetical protein
MSAVDARSPHPGSDGTLSRTACERCRRQKVRHVPSEKPSADTRADSFVAAVNVQPARDVVASQSPAPILSWPVVDVCQFVANLCGPSRPALSLMQLQ